MTKNSNLEKLDMMKDIISIAERAEKAKNTKKFDLALRVLLDVTEKLQAENTAPKPDLDKCSFC